MPPPWATGAASCKGLLLTSRSLVTTYYTTSHPRGMTSCSRAVDVVHCPLCAHQKQVNPCLALHQLFQVTLHCLLGLCGTHCSLLPPTVASHPLHLHMCPQSPYSAGKGSCCAGTMGMPMWRPCNSCRGQGTAGVVRSMATAGRGHQLGLCCMRDFLGSLPGVTRLPQGDQVSEAPTGAWGMSSKPTLS